MRANTTTSSGNQQQDDKRSRDNFGLMPSRALPVEEDDGILQDDEYELPEEYMMAVSYLKGVRNESEQTPNLFISKTFQEHIASS